MSLAAKVRTTEAPDGDGSPGRGVGGLMDRSEIGEKRPGAFRTISEVADDLDVPQHVLRFWETKFVQIKPVKRAGGRRYYRPDDVDLIKGVRRLLHDQGYTIKGAQRVLKENGIRFVQSVGRGEAEVAAPTQRDLESAEAEADTAAGSPEGDGAREAADGPANGPDRQALEAVLDELYACREALAALRDPPDISAEA